MISRPPHPLRSSKRSPFDGDEAVVEIRPLFDPPEFDVPGEAEERARKLGQA